MREEHLKKDVSFGGRRRTNDFNDIARAKRKAMKRRKKKRRTRTRNPR